jgi:predicted transglutaminase-like cysteine proteinase
MFCAAIAAAIMIVSSAGARAASEQLTYVSIGATTRAPIGWVEFCNDNPKECPQNSVEPRDIVLTTKVWKDLVRINRWVNDTIQPETDMDHWGVLER